MLKQKNCRQSLAQGREAKFQFPYASANLPEALQVATVSVEPMTIRKYERRV